MKSPAALGGRSTAPSDLPRRCARCGRRLSAPVPNTGSTAVLVRSTTARVSARAERQPYGRGMPARRRRSRPAGDGTPGSARPSEPSWIGFGVLALGMPTPRLLPAVETAMFSPARCSRGPRRALSSRRPLAALGGPALLAGHRESSRTPTRGSTRRWAPLTPSTRLPASVGDVAGVRPPRVVPSPSALESTSWRRPADLQARSGPPRRSAPVSVCQRRVRAHQVLISVLRAPGEALLRSAAAARCRHCRRSSSPAASSASSPW